MKQGGLFKKRVEWVWAQWMVRENAELIIEKCFSYKLQNCLTWVMTEV